MLVRLENLSTVLIMTSSKFVLISNRSYARPVNSGKITMHVMRSFKGNIFHSAAKFDHKKLATLRCYMVKTWSRYLILSWIGTGT